MLRFGEVVLVLADAERDQLGCDGFEYGAERDCFGGERSDGAQVGVARGAADVGCSATNMIRQ